MTLHITLLAYTTTPFKQIGEKKTDYQTLYREYVKLHHIDEEIDEFGGWEYIYLDEDDIPELFISSGYPITPAHILSVVNGRVVESSTSDGFSYIPRKGRILAGRGMHMSQNNAYLQSFKNGKNTNLYTFLLDYSNRDGDGYDEDEPEHHIDEKKTDITTFEKFLNDKYFKLGKYIKAGSDGNNLLPMEELWQ